jgi:cytochrome c-type biogenesis protein CcsB
MITAAAVASWLIVLTRTRVRSIGLFVLLPIVILVFVAGTVLYVPASSLVPALQTYWLVIHVLAISVATGMLMLSGVASGLYLLRTRSQPSRTAAGGHDPADATRRGPFAALPSPDTLDRIAYRTAIVAFPVYTFAVLAGAMWAEAAWGRYWGWDPKETTAFITWIIYAGYLHARATAGWRGRRAAWIPLLGLAAILFNLFFVNMVVSGLHSYAGLN